MNAHIKTAKHVTLPKGWSLSRRMTVRNVGVWNAERRRYVSRNASGYMLTDEFGVERFLEGSAESILPQLALILENHGYAL